MAAFDETKDPKVEQLRLFVFVQDSDDEMLASETPGAAGAASSAVVEEEVFPL